MKILYLSSLLSIVAYVSAIRNCPVGGASAGVYGPNAGDCGATCAFRGTGISENCLWDGDSTFCLLFV
ncbi:unnamed protein product [Cunninghamella echinulata]